MQMLSAMRRNTKRTSFLLYKAESGIQAGHPVQRKEFSGSLEYSLEIIYPFEILCYLLEKFQSKCILLWFASWYKNFIQSTNPY